MPYFNRKKRNYAQMAGKAVQAYQLYKKARSYTKSRTYKKPSTSQGITQQHDARMVYRRKKMPYRKKKQWVKFSRKVNAVIQKAISVSSVVYSDSISSTSGTTVNQQGYQIHLLYGKKGVPAATPIDSGTDDIWNTLRKGSATLPGNQKFQFSSAVLDLTAVNTSVALQEVDLYHVVFWKETSFSSPLTALIDAEASTPASFGTTLTLSQRGVTPFELPLWIRGTGMKILKKMKYFIEPNNAITYQIRDPRNRFINGNEVNDNSNDYCQPGWTQGVLILHRPVPGNATLPDPGYTMNVGCTRKYGVKVLQDNSVTDSYVLGRG